MDFQISVVTFILLKINKSNVIGATIKLNLVGSSTGYKGVIIAKNYHNPLLGVVYFSPMHATLILTRTCRKHLINTVINWTYRGSISFGICLGKIVISSIFTNYDELAKY